LGIEDTINASLAKERPRRRSGNRGFWLTAFLSLGIHVGIGAAALYAQPKRQTIDLNRAIPVQLVKLGKKRDPALLPRIYEPPPPPKDEGVALAKDEPTPPPKDEKKKSKDELSDAAKRLLDSDKRLDEALRKVTPDDPEGDESGSELGTTSDTSNAAAGYIAEIGRALQSNYRLPEAIPASQRKFLKARVLLFIEPNGKVREFSFVEAHPNNLFMGALESLLKTVHLPPPPKAEAKRFQNEGVEVVFRP
jgi:outer membrane biosynthesis protein TonB